MVHVGKCLRSAIYQVQVGLFEYDTPGIQLPNGFYSMLHASRVGFEIHTNTETSSLISVSIG